ncbi:uncharacterized protein LOC118459687 isoform X2 [Anopheles albimanus]|uniref:uncharacterized protein LOC118459687 isoform X2 n=1 Tax=Anopheles albimanus TaxID=7167 RepID=UPI0016413C0E|nr:uncharacterized protein LOC118459687 isoform X2 [Anopheles albimanus]
MITESITVVATSLYSMGVFREQRGILVLLSWFAVYPSVAIAHRNRRAHGGSVASSWKYYLRIATVILLMLLLTAFRIILIVSSDPFLRSLSYMVWMFATLCDAAIFVTIILANALNVNSFLMLSSVMARLEDSCDARMGGLSSSHSFRSIGFHAYIILHTLLNIYYISINYSKALIVIFQLRIEVLLIDFYIAHLTFLLLTVGDYAKRLGNLIADTVTATTGINMAEFCRLLRLRDDLLHCIALINRIYGVLFISASVSWFAGVTGVLYFDFLMDGTLDLSYDRPYALAHFIMVLMKSIDVGGLLMVAEHVTDRLNGMTQLIHRLALQPLPLQHANRPLRKLIEKLLMKNHFQNTDLTAYGMFKIANSLSYTAVRS